MRILLERFSVRELADEARACGRLYSGTKESLVSQVLGEPDAPTAAQALYISGLCRKPQCPRLQPSDLRTKLTASMWLDAAIPATSR